MNEFVTAGDTGIPYLYRYQPFSLERLRSVIVDKQLYFSRPSSFNDPWDCKPCFDIDLSDEESVAAHIDFFVRTDRQHNHHLSEAELLARATRIREDRPFLESCVKDMYSIHKMIDRQYRIYCLAGSPIVPLMWSHYAEKHTGICFRFSNYGPFSVALRVHYNDHYPSFSLVGSNANAVKTLLAKSSDWSYEEEYRIIAQERQEAAVGATLMTDNSIMRFPAECLRSVYLGCQITADHRSQVLALARESSANVAVRQMTLVRDRYALIDVEVPL